MAMTPELLRIQALHRWRLGVGAFWAAMSCMVVFSVWNTSLLDLWPHAPSGFGAWAASTLTFSACIVASTLCKTWLLTSAWLSRRAGTATAALTPRSHSPSCRASAVDRVAPPRAEPALLAAPCAICVHGRDVHAGVPAPPRACAHDPPCARMRRQQVRTRTLACGAALMWLSDARSEVCMSPEHFFLVYCGALAGLVHSVGYLAGEVRTAPPVTARPLTCCTQGYYIGVPRLHIGRVDAVRGRLTGLARRSLRHVALGLPLAAVTWRVLGRWLLALSRALCQLAFRCPPTHKRPTPAAHLTRVPPLSEPVLLLDAEAHSAVALLPSLHSGLQALVGTSLLHFSFSLATLVLMVVLTEVRHAHAPAAAAMAPSPHTSAREHSRCRSSPLPCACWGCSDRLQPLRAEPSTPPPHRRQPCWHALCTSPWLA